MSWQLLKNFRICNGWRLIFVGNKTSSETNVSFSRVRLLEFQRNIEHFVNAMSDVQNGIKIIFKGEVNITG